MSNLSRGDEDLHGPRDRHRRVPPEDQREAGRAWRHRALAHENAHRAHGHAYEFVPATEESTVEIWR